MKDADDALVGDLIDVAALDVEQILAADHTPLAGCLRRLIQLDSRGGTAVAGFESFIGRDESTDAIQLSSSVRRPRSADTSPPIRSQDR